MNDTTAQAARMQRELLRRASPARRAQTVWALSDMVRRNAREAMRRVHPDYSERQLSLAFVAHCYGDELAEGLRAFWGEPGE